MSLKTLMQKLLVFLQIQFIHILHGSTQIVKTAALEQLKYPLAADTNHEVSRNYGVLIEEEGIALRGLFIINPEGELQYQTVFHNNIGRDVDESLRVLQALQTGGLCPANWRPGQKTL